MNEAGRVPVGVRRLSSGYSLRHPWHQDEGGQEAKFEHIWHRGAKCFLTRPAC